MSELRDLYQEVIIDHSKKPRNFHEISNPDRKVEGYNPLCGDKLTLYVILEQEIIKDVAFVGSGCAISTASASLMTDAIKGKSITDAEQLFVGFHQMVTEGNCLTPNLGKLTVLAGVHEFPLRVKCATLAWHTLHAALKNKDDAVTTE